MNMYANNQLKQNPESMQKVCSEIPRPISPIEERAQTLEKELFALAEVVTALAGRIEKVMTPAIDDSAKNGIGTPSAPMSPMTRAFDYAINSVVAQRIELARMIDRIEL